MSIESVARALDVSAVKGTTKLVLLGIANHDGDNGAWPAVATLARYAVCSKRRVQQCLAELEEAGLITVELNAGGLKDWREDRRPNRYQLHLDGAKPTAPRDDNGVQSSAERGEIQSTNGVKPASPKPSSNHPEEPSTSSSSPTEIESLVTSGAFEAWWEMYRAASDRPGSKGDAFMAWMKLRKDDAALACSGLRRHHDCVLASPGRYVMPNGSTWLNKRRWLDETPQEPPHRQANTHNGIATLRAIRDEEARR